MTSTRIFTRQSPSDLLADKSLVFFYRIFGLNSDQREKVGVNSDVRITLAKFLASASSLLCPCLGSAFLFEKKMEPAVKRTESREVCLTHEIQELFYLLSWSTYRNLLPCTFVFLYHGTLKR